ncbi:MAG: hypothetical protein QMC39_09645 [Flavobacteriales bacterium]
MNEKIDNIFRDNLGNVQVHPAQSVKNGLVKEVRSIIYRKALFSIAIITTSVSVLVITSSLVFQNANKGSNDVSHDYEGQNTGLLSLNNSLEQTTSKAINTEDDFDLESIENDTPNKLEPNPPELLAQKSPATNADLLTNSQSNYSKEVTTEPSNSNVFSLESTGKKTKQNDYSITNEITAIQLIKTQKPQLHSEPNSKNEITAMESSKTIESSNRKPKEVRPTDKYSQSNTQSNLNSLETAPELTHPRFSTEEGLTQESSITYDFHKTIDASNELRELDKVYSELDSELGNTPTEIHNCNPFEIGSDKKFWSIGIASGYGNYSNSLNSSSQNADVQRATAINSKSNYLGVFTSRELGRLKFSLGTGIERMSQSYSVSTISRTEEEIGSYVDLYEVVIIDGNPTQVYVGQEYVTSLVEKEEEITSGLTNQIDYLQIPFSVGYDLFRGSRFDAGFSAGIIYNHQLNSTGDVLNELSGVISSLELDKSLVNKSLWHYQMGFTINRNITQRISVRVNPRLRIASSKQFDELRIQSTNYSGLDINFGLQIKL